MEIFYSEEKVAQDQGSENRFRRNRGSSVPAVQNRLSAIPSGSGLSDGLTHCITVVKLAISNKMEDNLTEVRKDWISEIRRLSLCTERFPDFCGGLYV